MSKVSRVLQLQLMQKKRGEQPTAPLYRNAKESGFKSAAEMLAVKKASEVSGLNKKLEVHFSGEFGKENCIDTNDAPFQEESKTIEEEILLSPGTKLKEIFGIEVPSKDVGNALQLLEFCKVFGKALDLKEGEAEAILEELVCKQNMHGENTFLIEFHIRVLDLILNNSRNEKLRSYIHEENSRHAKEVKEAKHKVAATKEKVKCLEKKLRSEKAKVVHSSVSPFPMEEHEALLSKIRIEVDEAHTDMLGLKGITQKAKLGCDALRIKPEFVDDPAG
ncbi:uncharacterized protein [Phaseolus vulgaris]|uniref:uncharacterized protein isoform X4 n=1 Tax=Phaseolus vulgaris TaxID=3885 RepID=UPI0035CB8FFB